LRSPLPFFGGPVVGFEFGILAPFPLQIKALQAGFRSGFYAPVAGLSPWIKSAISAHHHTHFSKSVFIGFKLTFLLLPGGGCGESKPFLRLMCVAHFMV